MQKVLHCYRRLSYFHRECRDFWDICQTQQNISWMQVRQLLLDPAVQKEFERMKTELEKAAKEMKTLQEELQAVQFSQDSKTGRMLMAKCRALQVSKKPSDHLILVACWRKNGMLRLCATWVQACLDRMLFFLHKVTQCILQRVPARVQAEVFVLQIGSNEVHSLADWFKSPGSITKPKRNTANIVQASCWSWAVMWIGKMSHSAEIVAESGLLAQHINVLSIPTVLDVLHV